MQLELLPLLHGKFVGQGFKLIFYNDNKSNAGI